MNDVLNSLTSDLTSRRLLPLVALVVVAFLAAVAYAVVGGSSKAPTPVAAVHPASTTAVALTPAPANPTEAVAETPAGSRYQRTGGAHDPFLQLPKPRSVKFKAATKPATGGTGSTPSGSTTTSTPSTPTPKPAPTPAKPKQPTTEYDVAVLLVRCPL